MTSLLGSALSKDSCSRLVGVLNFWKVKKNLVKEVTRAGLNADGTYLITKAVFLQL